MDTVTHIVLGACIGEVIAGKQLGKKVLLLGALAQNIPDIDVVAAFWLPTSADLLAHRGFTHSFLFVLLITPLLAFLSRRSFRTDGMTIKRWALFWGLQVFIHIFIDAFNAYGTGWFEPFSHYRVSFNSMFVADPLFSIWPAIVMVVLLILKTTNIYRRSFSYIAMAISSLYLLFGVVNKMVVDNSVKKSIQAGHLSVSHVLTTPTPLNNLLWYVIAQNDSGYYIGYRSIFDNSENIDFHYVYKNDTLLKMIANKQNLDRLITFSEGYYAAEMWHDTLVLNDLRFGEIKGWEVANPRFVCHYYLQYPEANKMIVQRGRFEGWDKHAVETFIKRIRGN